ncbi:hypothetical protein ACFCT7_04680 [Fulvivirgaceae bacterium LMO-SS25]
MSLRISVILITIFIICCKSNNEYEKEEIISLSKTLPEVFESFYYSNYCLWVENELSVFFDTIPSNRNNQSAELTFKELVKEKCDLTHFVEFDGYLISLPEAIKENNWTINPSDTKDLTYLRLTSTPYFKSLEKKFIGLENLSFHHKYQIIPVGLEVPELEKGFKFRLEVSRVSFNELGTQGFYFLTIWKGGEFQLTGTITLVLIEKEKHKWVVKEIKYHRRK